MAWRSFGMAALVVAFATLPPKLPQRPQTPEQRPPIIDVHLHAMPANYFGAPPSQICYGDVNFPGRDPRGPANQSLHTCSQPLRSPMTDDDLMRQTLSVMERYNVVGVTSGPIEFVRRWHAAAPDRIIPGVVSDGTDSVETIRRWAADGTIRVLGELTFQYAGLKPGDAVPESYFALAEQLDVPAAVHVGPGPPGAAYVGFPKYRMALSDPLLFEDVLVRHPKLRLYMMHAGWPMADRLMALLYAHPQVYVDVAVIDWILPRKEFHAYLRRLVDAGFGDRVMFGSDQMLWPEGLRIAIENVEAADFLTARQKRDIFYNNAARFFRLSTDTATGH